MPLQLFQPMVNVAEATLQEFEVTEFKCVTKNVIYRPQNNASVLKWTVDGYENIDHITVFNESYYDCSQTNIIGGENDQLCHFQSFLRWNSSSRQTNVTR